MNEPRFGPSPTRDAEESERRSQDLIKRLQALEPAGTEVHATCNDAAAWIAELQAAVEVHWNAYCGVVARIKRVDTRVRQLEQTAPVEELEEWRAVGRFIVEAYPLPVQDVTPAYVRAVVNGIRTANASLRDALKGPQGPCTLCSSQPDDPAPCECAHAPCIHDRNTRIKELEAAATETERKHAEDLQVAFNANDDVMRQRGRAEASAEADELREERDRLRNERDRLRQALDAVCSVMEDLR